MNKKVILIVEDSSESRSLMKEILLATGYDVLEADDGESAYAIFATHEPDLLLVDVLMPKMNGNIFVQKIRSLEKGKIISVVIVTARRLMEGYFEEFHVDGFLTKPLDSEKLLSLVKKLLDEREENQVFQEKVKHLKGLVIKDGKSRSKRMRQKICEDCQSFVLVEQINCPVCGSIRLRVEEV